MLKFLRKALLGYDAIRAPYLIGCRVGRKQRFVRYSAWTAEEAVEWVRLNKPIGGRFAILQRNALGIVTTEVWGTI